MSDGTAGGGDRNEDQGSETRKNVSEILDGIESRFVQREGMTPEQGCLGCSLGIGLLVLTLIVWICVYSYYNPEFHEHAAPLPAILDPTPRPPRAMPTMRHASPISDPALTGRPAH